MNTTHSTTDETLPYTVVGGRHVDRASNPTDLITLVVLNRGRSANRSGFFGRLLDLGFTDILSVENSGAHYDVEGLSRAHRDVRFLLLRRKTSVGEQVNVSMQEARGLFVYVVWNDMRVSPVTDGMREALRARNFLCTAPFLRNQKSEVLPTAMTPAFHRSRLKVLALQPAYTGTPTVYPYDYVGVYNREQFVFSGGYDHRISSPYWQKLDFGFRAHMWGYTIQVDPQFTATSTQVPAEDATPDESYKRFFLKNLSVRFSADQATLPLSRFPGFAVRTGGGLYRNWRLFREIQDWVRENRYRFKQDSRRVTELWEPEK
ncbi:MAG: glycosyltransferase family 2 protein [Spirochaetota bacterium]